MDIVVVALALEVGSGAELAILTDTWWDIELLPKPSKVMLCHLVQTNAGSDVESLLMSYSMEADIYQCEKKNYSKLASTYDEVPLRLCINKRKSIQSTEWNHC